MRKAPADLFISWNIVAFVRLLLQEAATIKTHNWEEGYERIVNLQK